MKLYFTCALIFIYSLAFAQTKTSSQPLTKLQTWQLLDYEQDSVYGTSVNRAYKELLKGKKSHPVIVAVIDEGVDITQEDLQGHIWTNKKEIAGNGIDDDNNGYIDDVYGWNFLGGKDGRMMYAVSTEGDREYARLLPKYTQVKDSTSEAGNKEYAYFLKEKAMHLKDSASREGSAELSDIHHFDSTVEQFQTLIQKKKVYYEDINSYQPKDSAGDATKKYLLDFYTHVPAQVKSMDLDSGNLDPARQAFIRKLEADDSIDQLLFVPLKNNLNGLRKEIVGDDPYNINDTHYGNNNIEDSKYGFHGTFCSGIIAASRNNGIGMDGITDNVLIMPLRVCNTVAPGDEQDKDVALAIRYAVNNGAKIINMNLGKYLSPQKQWVDDAVKYAERKGVLIIHGAGNDNTNLDSTNFYPDADFLDSSGRAGNMITVGAISIDTGFSLPYIFSNYGKKQVDVFAPGVEIYSSAPGNKYYAGTGTSFAGPQVAGVAALILEYYPNLKAEQVKDIILKSVTSLKGKIVYKPNTLEKVDFATLCVTGGVVNSYKALQLAATYSSNKN